MLTSNVWRSLVTPHCPRGLNVSTVVFCMRKLVSSLSIIHLQLRNVSILSVCVYMGFSAKEPCAADGGGFVVMLCVHRAFPINIQNRYLLLLRLENCDVMEEDECVCVHVHLADF